MKNKIIIVAGEPNSINSEIIYKSWKKLDIKLKKQIYLIVNLNLISKQFKELGYKINLIKVNNINDKINSNYLKIIDVPLKFKSPFDVSFPNSSQYIVRSLNLAHKFALNKNVKGLINCSIDKKALIKTKKIGVTEFFASKCNLHNHEEVMMIHNKKLSVVPITTHLKLKKISQSIKINIIIKKIITLDKYFKKIFKKRPRIGVLGLNPHNAELTRNSEEVKQIIPAINLLKKRGYKILGPLVADTVFINTYKKFDVIVGMYHDQVLSPFKTLFHFDAINITLGLKYLRVSPDHGPATDLVGKNKANYISLLQCIRFLKDFK